MKYYYLINNQVKVSDSKIPDEKKHPLKTTYNLAYNNWLSSLQPCEISESELCLILSNVSKLDYDSYVEVTDIISDNNGVITFKEKLVYYTFQEENEIFKNKK